MTDEMYTTKQGALYLGITEADLRLAIRGGKLRAWRLPDGRGLLVRKSDLIHFRMPGGRSTLSHQLPLFAADKRADNGDEAATEQKTSAA